MTETANAAKTRSAAPRPAQVAWVALCAFAGVVAAASFALTYHGLYGYGRDVARLGDFAWLVPVAVDGATLCAIAATFLLAHTALRVRAYAWLVFLATNTLSVLGNLAFAHSHGLGWQGSVGAGAWPVLVTLVAHLGIVAWRQSPLGVHPEERSALKRPRPRALAPEDSPPQTSLAPAVQPDERPGPTTAATPRRRGGGRRRTTPQQRTEALGLLDDGLSAARTALKVGVSKRTVEIWRKERTDQQQSQNDQEVL
jgi:hypothetical protein